MATVATQLNSGSGFASGEIVTATKLNNLVNTATVTGIVNADIDAAAGISYAKLALSNSIVAGDITSNAITTAKISDANVTFAKLSLPSGFPIQIVGATKTDIQYWSSGSVSTWYDITGLSVTLTRAIASSAGKIRIQAAIPCASYNANYPPSFRIVRNSDAIGLGDAAGNRSRVTSSSAYTTPLGGMDSAVIDFIDSSPGSSATVTYKIQIKPASTNEFYVNRPYNDADDAYTPRGISTLTLTELAP